MPKTKKGLSTMASKKTATEKTAKPYVIVRTYSAGVHFGRLVSRTGDEVVLDGSRRIWRWRGANTLSELATRGCDVSKSAIACAVDGHLIKGMIEILPCAPDVAKAIEGATAWNP